MDLGAFISSEWQAVTQAPLLFSTALIVAAVAIAGGAWAAINWSYEAQLKSLDARNKLLGETVNEYKRKLDGASPDQAKDKIEALEARTAALEAEIRKASETDYAKIFEENLRNVRFIVDGGEEP